VGLSRHLRIHLPTPNPSRKREGDKWRFTFTGAAPLAIERAPIFESPENFTMATATDDRLRLLIERVERLEEEKKGIADDIRDTYAEAKAVGYDAKIMRQIVRLRKMKPDDRAEMEAILDTYKAALGLG
jgi:uncharacterized protein (UPF0335 family)